MAEMTKEILLSGTRFRNLHSMGLFFSCKGGPENYHLLMSLRSYGESLYFGNISKIDSKGFNYYAYDFLGKRKLSARVKYDDLIAYPDKIIPENSGQEWKTEFTIGKEASNA